MVNKSFGKIVLIFKGKTLIFQTYLVYTIHSLKYLRSTTLGCEDIGKSEFETKTQ